MVGTITEKNTLWKEVQIQQINIIIIIYKTIKNSSLLTQGLEICGKKSSKKGQIIL